MAFSFTVVIPSTVEYSVPLLIVTVLVVTAAFIIQNRRIVNNLQDPKRKLTIQTDKSVKKRSASRLENLLPDVPQEKPTIATLRRNHSYRMEEEHSKKSSSEYTRRGQLWSRHASWNLPKAPRSHRAMFRYPVQGLEHVIAILSKFDVDPRRGFLPSQDPLQRLPYARYHLWEDLGDDLPKLLGARLGQARDPLRQLPVVLTDKLVTYAELRRAHLLLCLFAHAYVWGGPEPLDHIPEGIARPLWEVSQRLGMPPVLGHPSIVLYNWRRLDAEADICMENLSTLNNFFDGRDESWFYLITVEVEAKGAASVVPMMLSIDAIQRHNEEKELQLLRKDRLRNRTESSMSFMSDKSQESVDALEEQRIVRIRREDGNWDVDDSLERKLLSSVGEMEQEGDVRDEEALIGELTASNVAIYVSSQLRKIAGSIKGMCDSLGAMREGCHPFIFYHRVRPFLSAWKHNPTLPLGVIYEGVSKERQQFYGGSAAQSTLLPFLDIGLGVSHESTKSSEFLFSMRDYMPVKHREFLEYLETISCVRQFVVENLAIHEVAAAMSSASTDEAEKSRYASRMNKEKKIFLELKESYDACISGLQAFRTSHISLVADYIIAQQKKGVNKEKLEGSAGGKGTGGTDLMKFLKPIRDNCGESLLASPVAKPASPRSSEQAYIKDNGCSDDIDLYRGAANTARKGIYTMPADEGWDVATSGEIVTPLFKQTQ